MAVTFTVKVHQGITAREAWLQSCFNTGCFSVNSEQCIIQRPVWPSLKTSRLCEWNTDISNFGENCALRTRCRGESPPLLCYFEQAFLLSKCTQLSIIFIGFCNSIVYTSKSTMVDQQVWNIWLMCHLEDETIKNNKREDRGPHYGTIVNLKFEYLHLKTNAIYSANWITTTSFQFTDK